MATSNALAPSGSPKKVIVGINVKFELNAKNGLRRILFGLEKNTKGTDVTWKINFTLFERAKKTDQYGDPLVKLDVQVDAKLNSKAEKAADDGLSPLQAAHALSAAAEDAKGTTTGEVTKADAKDTIEATLKKK